MADFDSQVGRPRVSVIMPVYDGVAIDELNAACASIVSQVYRDFEFLILKDGIKRGDLSEAIDQFAQRDQRVRTISSPTNRGIAASLNVLVRESRGEFIAGMDADDISLSNRLEMQVKYLEEHPEIDLLGASAEEIDAQGNVLFVKRMPVAQSDISRFLCRRDPFIHPTVVFRKRFFSLVGDYNDSKQYAYLEDTELWVRALAAGILAANLSDILFLFRANQQFYGRRRGWRFAWNESALRIRFIRQSRLPKHLMIYPIAAFFARLMPSTALRWMYFHLR